ncbi:peptidoglycan-binding domain-containing protein [Ornithinimicrobium panacihumi]|uniref:peptidoglycan-binding domain-containing protein n=1 Tax=Ornithinimicrobium panacihumi TaxID=2008449 RepID=UPI003F8B6245
MRRVLGVLLVLVLLAAAVGAGWWASRATLTSQVPEEDAAGAGAASQVVWAEASQGSVGRSLPLSTTLLQPALPVAANSLAGVVTSVSPGEVDQGGVVYVVGATPVRVVEAGAPFWRDLALNSKGDDVTALQELLVDEGHLEGEADGDFGPVTQRAVKAWQKGQGREQTGVVPLGELVAVSDLPAVVQLGEGIVVGKTLAGGEDSVLAPTGVREFVLVVTAEQARLIPAEATVEITFEDHTWDAVIGGSELDEYGSTTFTLTAPDGGEVCGEECGVLPNDAQVTLRSRVVVVPEVSGTTVPAAAVRSRPGGGTYVVTAAGEVDVTVAGSGQGIAVIEPTGGELGPGTRVQVTGDGTAPAPAQPAPQQQPPSPAPGEGGEGDGAGSTQDG